MANNIDRAGLIKDLQGAFSTNKEETKDDYGRLTIETLSVDKHTVNRITNIKQPEPDEIAYTKYPEAYSIKELIDVLLASKDSNANDTAKILKNKFIQAAENNDTERIALLSKQAKELHLRLFTTLVGTSKRAMTIVFIEDIIKKL